MRKLVILLFSVLCFRAHSQSLVDSISYSGFTLSDSVGEALANLAIKNPSMKVIDKQVEASKYAWQANKYSYLNNLSASFNLNEFHFRKKDAGTPLPGATEANQNLYFPRYNFNLLIPMGIFVTKGKQIKQSKAQYEEILAQKEVNVFNLKQEILVSYQNYQMSRYLLALQETVVQDEALVFAQMEDKFRNGSVAMEIFANSSKRFHTELTKRVTLMRDMNVAKYNLELLIGMKLEEAMKIIGVKQNVKK